MVWDAEDEGLGESPRLSNVSVAGAVHRIPCSLPAETPPTAALLAISCRITTNLLAIGLCPQAILAVISPPGHALSLAPALPAVGAAATAAEGVAEAARDDDAVVAVMSAAADQPAAAQDPAQSGAVAIPARGASHAHSRGGSSGGAVPLASELFGSAARSFGAVGGGSLCGGLGLACLGAMTVVGGQGGEAGGHGHEEVEEDCWAEELPACGDISALLAMSDDDDAYGS